MKNIAKAKQQHFFWISFVILSFFVISMLPSYFVFACSVPPKKDGKNLDLSELIKNYKLSFKNIPDIIEFQGLDKLKEIHRKRSEEFCQQLSALKDDVIKSLDESDDNMKLDVLMSINICSLYNKQVIEKIVSLLETENTDIRAEAIKAIIYAGADNSKELAEEILINDPDKSVRFAVVWALYNKIEIIDSSYCDLLIVALFDKNSTVASTAASTLAKMDKEVVNQLILEAKEKYKSQEQKKVLDDFLKFVEEKKQLDKSWFPEKSPNNQSKDKSSK